MPAKKTRPPKVRVSPGNIDDISPALLRKLERQIDDIKDPRRYVLRAAPDPFMLWELFYNISEDTFGTDIEHATLFKRRKTAVVIAGLLRTPSRIEEVHYERGKPIVRPRKPSPRGTKRQRGRSRRRVVVGS